MKKKSAARKFGKFFAHLQSAFDDLSTWGFSMLKKAGEGSESVVLDSEEPLSYLKKSTKKVAHFIGEMGESFYSEYEKIKAKKVKK